MKKVIFTIVTLLLLYSNIIAQIPGTIIAYGGTWESLKHIEVEGWLVCDGRLYDRTDVKYQRLFNAIGTSWGGDGGNKFAVPDLRGLFLRGVVEGADTDPDVNMRTKSRPDLNSSGNGGNAVGSKQPDAFARHHHNISRSDQVGNGYEQWLTHDINGAPSNIGKDSFHFVTEDAGTTTETRPKNAYVYYIIKL
ncbi:MAG: tail fiber protein [Bacteroidetes bacterium]|nr:tail fiber protein [Bacteroidota bacterium]